MTESLVQILERYTSGGRGESPFATPIQGLTLLRSDREKLPSNLIFKPALCVVAQGEKWTVFGNKRFHYRAGQALIVSLEMPAFSRVSKASPGDPYLGLVLEFDLAIMSEMREGLELPPNPAKEGDCGVFVTDFAGPLEDCVLRMVRLLDTPEAIPAISPLIMREICYRLLTGPDGGAIARIVLANSHTQRIIKAIHVLRDRYVNTVRIEDLAAIAQMSPSAFHRRFKALTSMTPLQYQKQLRLLEARHLLVAGAANAETAALKVGYESPSQFSREYSRMFGAPPRRDLAALRDVTA